MEFRATNAHRDPHPRLPVLKSRCFYCLIDWYERGQSGQSVPYCDSFLIPQAIRVGLIDAAFGQDDKS